MIAVQRMKLFKCLCTGQKTTTCENNNMSIFVTGGLGVYNTCCFKVFFYKSVRRNDNSILEYSKIYLVSICRYDLGIHQKDDADIKELSPTILKRYRYSCANHHTERCLLLYQHQDFNRLWTSLVSSHGRIE